MVNEVVARRWAMLPGPKWDTTLHARKWLAEQRRLLKWSHKDVAEAFFKCAMQSALYSGPGGGAQFDRATEKRVARFEREGEQIPDWMYWLPLVIRHAQIPLADRCDWELDHIPEHRELLQEQADVECQARVFHLDDHEIALITRFREMDANERGVLHFFLEPRILRWWMETAMRADQANTNLVDLIDAALSP